MLQSICASICAKRVVARFYATSISPEARRKWGLDSVPPPRSILDDDDAVIDLSEDNDAVNGVRPNTPPAHLRSPPEKPTPYEWKAHRETIRKEFPGGWSPPRKLSREAMDGLRQLHHHDPEKFTTPLLAEKFRISPEAVRRILKSKWEPSREKRIKFAIREREEKQQFFKLSRLKERMEARALEENFGLKKRKSRGVSYGDDRLTLE
ncbi:hypothetical protein K443DRAFT_679591 [Laccaria amethystina LaAM-08-1]|jgi:hypothetical protein|uniref:Required for respiratory growth protein 9, mitochondrial n=2 Tax=Laccaria TaxID=29882 RepID=A0A0C9WPI5_9AGAR|nr:hypothetical protein K443DRAFT_679591 [Laccaria amethystina LaAM-08-1]